MSVRFPELDSTSPSQSAVDAALAAVQGITASIFASPGKYEHVEDCEIVGERYIEVHVSDKGTTDDVLSRLNEWHSQVATLPANVRRLFRLSVDVESE